MESLRSASSTQLNFTSVLVVYKSKSGQYRGFVIPYDLTYEAEAQEEVISVLNEMIDLYKEGLKHYNHPSHLSEVPLSDEEDKEKYTEISNDLMTNLKKQLGKVQTEGYYAEAHLSS